MTSRLHCFLGILLGQFLGLASLAIAQGGLSKAVQNLPTKLLTATSRSIDSPLYSGHIVATITNVQGDTTDFLQNDIITFQIGPRGKPCSDPGSKCLDFSGPRDTIGTLEGFKEWATANKVELTGILFPGSLSSSVLGRDAGELHAEQFLLTTALDTEQVRSDAQGGPTRVGGLIEYERINRERIQGESGHESGWAWQGIYKFSRTVSVEGRFADQREDVTTRAFTFSADYHPFVEFQRGGVRWRVGGTARGGPLYSRSKPMDLGSLEFGAGGWVSVFKNLGRVRVGGGTILQGSKSYVPDVRGFAFLADAINDRGIQYDLAYGGTVGVDMSSRTAVIVKFLDNLVLSSHDVRPHSWLLLTGLSYRFGLPSVNFGYKLYSTSGLKAHSIFVQGNFNW